MTMISTTFNPPSPSRRIARRVLRWVGRGAAGVFAVVLILALLGASYEAIAARRDAARFPAPGQLVDIGGYRLHLHCVGTGSPTVLLEAGMGGSSMDWRLVQSELGRTTRVCAYDRAGNGWSDSGLQPRTPRQIADELNRLLSNADINGPYVLVGHSLGGKYVRMFAIKHPDKVAGMVLVDARHEYVDVNTATDPIEEERVMQRMRRVQSLYRQLGIARLFGAQLLPALASEAQALPAELRRMYMIFYAAQKAIDARMGEVTARAADNQQLQVGSLGDRPLVVLAAGRVWHICRSGKRPSGSRPN